MYGCGYNFNDSAINITPGSIKFHFVARWTVPEDLFNNPNGVAGSLPAVMHPDSVYAYTFPAITVPATWNSDRLRCIAVLIDNNPQSPNYGFVLNSATTSHPPLTGTPVQVEQSLARAVRMKVYPNPARETVTVSFNLEQSDVTDVCIYDMLGRMVAVAPAQQMTGQQTIGVSTQDLVPGIYNVVLRSGTLRVSERISVVK